uniref:Uncharacterized protein n=1 Tax=Anguilla anguilla TaxID=7936 RepID=A0A0E9WHH0_ANGAN
MDTDIISKAANTVFLQIVKEVKCQTTGLVIHIHRRDPSYFINHGLVWKHGEPQTKKTPKHYLSYLEALKITTNLLHPPRQAWSSGASTFQVHSLVSQALLSTQQTATCTTGDSTDRHPPLPYNW